MFQVKLDQFPVFRISVAVRQGCREVVLVLVVAMGLFVAATRLAVGMAVVGLGVAGYEVVGFAVVGFTVVGLGVGLGVVGFKVVGLGVVGLGVGLGVVGLRVVGPGVGLLLGNKVTGAELGALMLALSSTWPRKDGLLWKTS